MQMWPAIGIRDGKCARLLQGDNDRERFFGGGLAAMAVRRFDRGASCLPRLDSNVAGAMGVATEIPSASRAIPSAFPVVDASRLVERVGGVFGRSVVESSPSTGFARVAIDAPPLSSVKPAPGMSDWPRAWMRRADWRRTKIGKTAGGVARCRAGHMVVHACFKISQ